MKRLFSQNAVLNNEAALHRLHEFTEVASYIYIYIYIIIK